MATAQRFLIINPFGIGDVLFTTPLIGALAEAFPGCEIDYWCNERVRDLFKHDPAIAQVFGLSRGDLKRIYQRSLLEGLRATFALARKIRRRRHSVAFDFSMDHRYGMACKAMGIKRRIGYNYRDRGRFLTDSITIQGFSGRHVAEYYLDLLRFLGIEPEIRPMTLTVPQHLAIKSRILLQALGVGDKDVLVGIAPGAGASWGKNAYYKHWPAIRYAHCADRLIEECGVKIILLGDASEQAIAESIVSVMRHKPLSLVGRTSLEEFAAMVGNCRALITNDGGPLHVAVARGVPTVSMFGPVDELVYGPYPASPKHMVIKKEMVCRPCYKKFRVPVCDLDRACINTITVDEVFQAVRSLL